MPETLHLIINHRVKPLKWLDQVPQNHNLIPLIYFAKLIHHLQNTDFWQYYSSLCLNFEIYIVSPQSSTSINFIVIDLHCVKKKLNGSFYPYINHELRTVKNGKIFLLSPLSVHFYLIWTYYYSFGCLKLINLSFSKSSLIPLLNHVWVAWYC